MPQLMEQHSWKLAGRSPRVHAACPTFTTSPPDPLPFLRCDWQVNEGSALTAGAVIAKLELDDPTKVKRAETFTGEWSGHQQHWVAVN